MCMTRAGKCEGVCVRATGWVANLPEPTAGTHARPTQAHAEAVYGWMVNQGSRAVCHFTNWVWRGMERLL